MSPPVGLPTIAVARSVPGTLARAGAGRQRDRLIARAKALSWLSLGWMTIEGAVGNVMHALGTSTGGRGKLKFTPAPGPGGTRTIVASATVDGSPIADQTLARFHFAGTVKAGQPRGVTVRRRGTTVTVSWPPVAGAIRYGVLVNRSDGAQRRLLVSAPRHSLTIKGYPLTDGGVVAVSAQGALGDWGRARQSARFKALKAPRSMFLAPRPKRR